MTGKFLVQKMSGGGVYDTSYWGIRVTSCPFMPYGKEAKDLPSNDWADEHGLDEWEPSTLCMKVYELKVEFVYKGDDAAVDIKSFIEFLANGGSNKFYAADSGMGRQLVRYKGYDDNAYWLNNGDDVVTFTLNFMVNDPVTNIVLTEA